MSVIVRHIVRLAEDQVLVLADAHYRCPAILVLADACRRSHDPLVEPRDPIRRTPWRLQLDIRNTAANVAELQRGLVAAELVAPGTGDGNMAVLVLPRELGAFELRRHCGQPLGQGR